MTISTEIEWAQGGTQFVPRSRADKVKALPSGIYRFVPTLGGWYLDRTGDNFEFPFKVYSACDHIINRIITFWTANNATLGVLLNGLRGAGKSMTAQLLANTLIKDRDLPVLVVKDPVPLQAIFDAVQQDIVVIFDEFEKTHNKEAQQDLLSTIDGMSRSKHNRLIIFTTNTTTIDENFKDRPSRIHYQFEFQRVADEIVEGLIDDSLPVDLHHFKGEIFDFLHSRQICTIDIVKAVIAEVRTFRESPLQFEEMLNISKGEPPSYTINVINPKDGTFLNTYSHFFKMDSGYAQNSSLLSGNRRAIQTWIDRGQTTELISRTWDGSHNVVLLEKCDEEYCWLAQLGVPVSKTFYGDFSSLRDGGYTLFLDNKPKDWKFPFTPEIVKNDPKEMEKLQDTYEESTSNRTVYATGERAVFKIKIEPNRNTITAPSRYQVTGGYFDA